MGIGRRPRPRCASAGFTLLEMLVALAIVAILASIAWPGYRQLMHRSQRLEARLALMRLQYLQERHFADHHVYASALRAEGGGDSLPADALSEEGNYDLSISLMEGGQGFVAIARARRSGRQAGDASCQRFSVDASGARRSAAAGGDWRPEPQAGCWS
jgi:type IV pilus assembly protein PilE